MASGRGPLSGPRARSRVLGLALGLLLSVAMLWVALRDVDVARLGATLAGADARLLLAGLVLMIAGLVCRSLRWRLLLWPVAHVGLLEINAFSMIGQVANALLPFKLGEVGRAALVARKYRVSFGEVLSTVAADRLLDLASLVLLALLLPLYIRLPVEIAGAIVTSGLTVLAGLVVLVLSAALPDGPRRLGRLVARLAGALLGVRLGEPLGERVAAFLRSFATGVRCLADVRRLAASVLYTLAGWLLITLYAACVLAAIGATPGLDAGAGLVPTVFTNLGSAAPSLPGYVGVYHGLATLAVELLGIDTTAAAGYAILAHGLWWLTAIVLGFAALAYEGASLADVRAAGEA
jgi:uncharacterized protein (TIRG00374 family)